MEPGHNRRHPMDDSGKSDKFHRMSRGKGREFLLLGENSVSRLVKNDNHSQGLP